MCKRYRRTKGKSYLFFLFVVIINTKFLFVFDLLNFLKFSTKHVEFEEFSLTLHFKLGALSPGRSALSFPDTYYHTIK